MSDPPIHRLPNGYRADVLVEFGILGPLEARRDGAEVPLGGRTQRAVLALLLLEAGRVVSIDRIAEELYAGDTPVSAVTQVHRQVSELRRALDPPDAERSAIETRAPGYLVHVEPDAVDLRRFERLCARADEALESEDATGALAALDDALALWRGEALADLATEAFAQRPIARLEELRQHALERRVEALLALGRHADVVPELSELAAAQPLRERLRELLMLALYRSGRQVDALQVYRQTRAALVEAFGVEPGPALRDLEQAILSHDPELAAAGGPAHGQPGGAVLVAGRDLDAVRLLATLGAPLARRPGLELIAAALLDDESGLAAATAALAAERAEQRRADARGGVRRKQRVRRRAAARPHLRRTARARRGAARVRLRRAAAARTRRPAGAQPRRCRPRCRRRRRIQRQAAA